MDTKIEQQQKKHNHSLLITERQVPIFYFLILCYSCSSLFFGFVAAQAFL